MALGNFAIFLFLFFTVVAFTAADHCTASAQYRHMCKKLGEKVYLIDGINRFNWFQADRWCRRHNAFLAHIENLEELTILTDHLVSTNVPAAGNDFWIGYNNLGSEEAFYSTETGQTMSFAKWSAGEPNNKYGNESCVNLLRIEDVAPLEMNDCNCLERKHFICEVNMQQMRC